MHNFVHSCICIQILKHRHSLFHLLSPPPISSRLTYGVTDCLLLDYVSQLQISQTGILILFHSLSQSQVILIITILVL